MKKHLFTLLVGLAVSTTPMTTSAQALDEASQKALQDTLELLRSPHLRQKAVNSSPEAQQAHGQAVQVVGQHRIDDLYQIAAVITEELVRQTGGDVAKMHALTAAAAKDPAKFANSLSPKSREMIRQLASKIQKVPRK